MYTRQQISLILLLCVPLVLSEKLFDGTKTFPMKFAKFEEHHEGEEKTIKYHFQIEMPMTTDTSRKPYPNPLYKFTPDMSASDVYHGLSSANDWGLNCSGTEETNCSVDNVDETEESEIYGHEFSYTKANTQFSMGTKVPELDQNPMPIKLITSPTKEEWEYGQAGILGLAPKSTFWSYLFEQYLPMKDNLAFTYNLQTNPENYWYQLFESREGHHTEDIFKGSELQISEVPGDLRDYDEPLLWTAGLQGNHWGVKDAQLWLSSDLKAPIHSGHACISSSSKATIISNQAEALQKKVYQAICNNDDCGAYEELRRAPELYLTFTDNQGNHRNLTIWVREYIYPKEEGGLGVSIDDITEHQGQACPEDATFGLGRMFLFSRKVIMKLERDGTQSVHFGEYSERPSLAKAEDVDNLVGVAIATIFVFMLYLIYLRMSGNSENIVDKIVPQGPVEVVQEEQGDMEEKEGIELDEA